MTKANSESAALLITSLQKLPVEYNENPRWSMKHETIYEVNRPFDIMCYKYALKAVRDYFCEWFKYSKSEAQVLLVTQGDYKEYYRAFPVLPYRTPKGQNILEQMAKPVIVVLPQENTPSNTIIEDTYWHQTVKGHPIMRIHSHHCLDAYQSQTDYLYLNSGTLEMVLGHIDREIPQCCYWLTRHSDRRCKEKVFQVSTEECQKLFLN